MTPEDIRSARRILGLTTTEMARLLGYEGTSAAGQISHHEAGRRRVRPAQRRLVEAYLSGYRPPDWPSRLIGAEVPEARQLGQASGREQPDAENDKADRPVADQP